MSDIYKAPEAELELEVENNSGGGKGITIPDGVKGWSWGAFLLSWIWALGNRSWIGLLALVPYVGIVMSIMLGVRGREWAWQNKRWDSLEHFNRVQRRWSIWALVLVLGIGGIGILAAVAIPQYASYAQTAKYYSAIADVQPVKLQVAEYVITNELWPASMTDLGYAEEVLMTSDGKFEIALYDNGIIGTRVGVDSSGEDMYIVHEPEPEGGMLQWICYGQNVRSSYLPASCQ